MRRVGFLVLFISSNYVIADKKREAETHLSQGKAFLAQGQYADALHHYHAAIELDPTNYQTYYQRATTLLATGKTKAALPDLDRVVDLKPDFIAGRVQRGSILMKQGKLSEAAQDFQIALETEPNNNHAQNKLDGISKLRDIITTIGHYLSESDYGNAESMLDVALEECSWDAELYRKRAKCRKERGDIQNAIADIRAIAKLVPDATEVYLEISELYYEVGDVENSLTQIRECLKLNPDHKKCFPLYKRIKKLAKLREQLEKLVGDQKWMDCLTKGQEIVKFEQNVDNVQLDVFRHTCQCNREAGHIAEAIQECTEVLKYGDPNDLHILCERGEAYILSEQFDKAIEDFQQAVNSHGESRKAKEGLNRAQKLLKQSQKKDYYKILGVKRNAKKRDIERAYRKMAQKWHPDNFHDEEEKKKAQEKFIDVASAKDVLTDPEKRKRFDSGEDPNDPEQTIHQNFHSFQGFHGFHGGGFPFGGDGGEHFSFKFSNF